LVAPSHLFNFLGRLQKDSFLAREKRWAVHFLLTFFL
jgi:hypothetical protein